MRKYDEKLFYSIFETCIRFFSLIKLTLLKSVNIQLLTGEKIFEFCNFLNLLEKCARSFTFLLSNFVIFRADGWRAVHIKLPRAKLAIIEGSIQNHSQGQSQTPNQNNSFGLPNIYDLIKPTVKSMTTCV